MIVFIHIIIHSYVWPVLSGALYAASIEVFVRLSPPKPPSLMRACAGAYL